MRKINRRLRFIAEPVEPDAAAAAGGSTVPDEGPGFPENTPVAEMTLEQQVAYFRHQSRLNESRWKSAQVDSREVQRLKQVEEQYQALQQESLSEQEKALNAAREEARREGEVIGAERYQRTAVTQAIKAAASTKGLYATDEQKAAVTALAEAVDFHTLLTEDADVDEGRIAALFAAFAPVSASATDATRDSYASTVRRLRQGEASAGSVAAAQAKYAEKYTTTH